MNIIPKRRGRPPKSTQIVPEDPPAEVVRVEAEPVAEAPDSAAILLAKRIWAGQSPDLPDHDRKARVAAGLAAQGYTMDGIEL